MVDTGEIIAIVIWLILLFEIIGCAVIYRKDIFPADGGEGVYPTRSIENIKIDDTIITSEIEWQTW